MIDIIIPAYKAQNTIDKLLASIYSQININDITVTIVNDGYGDYQENIKHFPDMKIIELSYGENKGCGFARQYGLEHTNKPFVIFCDSDDFLYDCTSIMKLIEPLEENENINCVYSPIQQYKDKKFVTIEKNLNIWLHGKSYRRSFLQEHKISFYFNSAGEDVGFNKQVSINCKENEIVQIKDKTYVWSDSNKDNRINTTKFAIFSSKQGLIDNMIYAMENAMKNGIDKQIISEELLGFFLDLYVQYNLYISHKSELDITDDECKQFINWCKPIYFLVKDMRLDSDTINNCIFNKSVLLYDFGYTFKGIKCTFEEFINKLEVLNEGSDLER